MRRRRKILWAVVPLAALHGLVLLAEFFAPYHYATQNRMLPYAPPTPVHFFDQEGRFHRPFVYELVPDETGMGYREDLTRPCSIRFFVKGEPYRLLGLFSTDRHLLGVDEPARLLLLGTDGFGRDQLSRLLHGGRISLFAGFLAAALSLGIGLALGSLAGFYGRWIDAVIMRGAELFMALPWLYLLLGARAFLPLSISPVQTFLLLVSLIGTIGWARPARLIRGVVLSARERDYVLAAKGFGAGDSYLLGRHVLPQTLGVVYTQAALLIPLYILAEVTLSFLGLGVAEPEPSWGNMLGELQKYHVLTSYWWMFSPGLVLVVVFIVYHHLARKL
ncbi:MAG: ABC transporter permease [bacterium]|nr:ABC transporter permease [bacterium]